MNVFNKIMEVNNGVNLDIHINDDSWMVRELSQKSMGYDEWVRFHPITGQLEIKYLDWNLVKGYFMDLYDKGWVCVN